MKISKHKLLDVEQKIGSTSGPLKKDPLFIIIHFTSGSSRESSVNYFLEPETKTSAHVVVGRDQKTTQLVDFNKIAWHAGKSKWKEHTNLNGFSIGIEIDNMGLLSEKSGEYFSWFNRKVDAKDVVCIDSQYWHRYTKWQINYVFELCKVLKNEYPSIRHVLGHSDIAPGRKIDPGPHFPMNLLQDSVHDEEAIASKKDMVVSTDLLNFRSGPGKTASIQSKPLKKGQRLKVLASYGGWSKVEVNLTGWVKTEYLSKG